MERSDGRHRTRNTKRLAAALQHCIDEAAERGVERVKTELKANISNWNAHDLDAGRRKGCAATTHRLRSILAEYNPA